MIITDGNATLIQSMRRALRGFEQIVCNTICLDFATPETPPIMD